MVCPVTVDRQTGVGILHHLFDYGVSCNCRQTDRCGHSDSQVWAFYIICLIMVCPVTVDRQTGVGILHHLFDYGVSCNCRQTDRCGHSTSSV